jgi:hypothetical protein
MARPMNVDKRVAAIAQMARRTRINAAKARRLADELTKFPRGGKAQRAAERARILAHGLEQAARAA